MNNKTEVKIEMRNEYTPVEVEVKIPVCSLEDTIKRLEQDGFCLAGTCREEDVYYNSAHYDLREHDKALRIRWVTDLDTGKTRAEFNCKGPKLDQVSVSRMELEMHLETPEILERILEELTFLPVPCAVRKTRFTYTRGGRVTVAVDRVEGLGNYLELEIIGQGEEQRPACLKEIEAVMKELGYEQKDTIRTSYLSMLQKKEEGEVQKK